MKNISFNIPITGRPEILDKELFCKKTLFKEECENHSVATFDEMWYKLNQEKNKQILK